MDPRPGIDDGRLTQNIIHFTRALRKAGIKVGSAQLETAIQAVATAGFSQRVDFYHILRATLITRADHLEVFHQVFSLFWRDPDFLESLIHVLSPRVKDDRPPPPPDAARKRAEEALGERAKDKPEPKPFEELVDHAVFSWSANEVLKSKDFEQMTNAEMAEAERAVRTLSLQVKPIRTRRSRGHPLGAQLDRRATLRRAMRRGGEVTALARKAHLSRPPDLVALCDISGSMSVYSRMVLRYLHALAHAPKRQTTNGAHTGWGQVHAFTFGTRLTNVTRALRVRDPDAALSAIGQDAQDWEGGTRIGAALESFNKQWSRRVLSTGAVVLLITDGLERGDPARLDREAARLARSVRKLIWLNPLLRYDGFAPKAGGVRTLLEHVDAFHGCHSLESLDSLSDALGGTDLRQRYLAESRALA